MPRDYLEEASSVIFGNKISLGKIVETDPDQVIVNLLNVLEKARGQMQAMIRKAAAYALGQIGDPRTMDALKEYHAAEQAPGVIDAMVAAMTAIKLAPTGSTHSQFERRQIMEDVYHGKRQADWW